MVETKGCIIATLSINLHSSAGGQGHPEQHSRGWAAERPSHLNSEHFPDSRQNMSVAAKLVHYVRPRVSIVRNTNRNKGNTSNQDAPDTAAEEEEVPEPSQETARKSVTELFRFADTRHTLNIWQRGNDWKSQLI